MKKYILSLFTILMISYVTASPPPLLQTTASHDSFPEYKGSITRFYDGDTGYAFWWIDGKQLFFTFRLIACDAPEEKNPYNGFKAQPYAYTSDSIMRSNFIRKDADFTYYGTDMYNRQVVKINVDNVDLTHYAVANGLAWRVSSELLTPFENKILNEEHKNARATKKGLWALRPLESPWTFRKKHRPSEFQISKEPIKLIPETSPSLEN